MRVMRKNGIEWDKIVVALSAYDVYQQLMWKALT